MSKRKDEIERELESYSSSSYNDLHKNLLIKIEEAMEDEGIPDKTSLVLAWMRGMIDSLYNIDHVDARKSFLAGKKSGVQIEPRGFKRIGEMVFFEYRPTGKSREKLDYWDRFPMVIIVDIHDDGFSGINMHHLSIKDREKLFLQLIRYVTNDKTDIEYSSRATIPRVKINYKLLSTNKKFRHFRPAYRRYKYNRITTKLLLIEPKYWDIAIYLPLDLFRKRKRYKVWLDNRQKIRNYERQRRRKQ